MDNFIYLKISYLNLLLSLKISIRGNKNINCYDLGVSVG